MTTTPTAPVAQIDLQAALDAAYPIPSKLHADNIRAYSCRTAFTLGWSTALARAGQQAGDAAGDPSALLTAESRQAIAAAVRKAFPTDLAGDGFVAQLIWNTEQACMAASAQIVADLRAQLASAQQDALERAAEICDGLHHNWRWDDAPDSNSGPRECAAAIRTQLTNTTATGN